MEHIWGPANGSYGTNGYDENWKHRFTYDVIDFQHLLKDSVEIDAFYSGWSSGFSVTLNFEFIEGTPPRTPIVLSNVYKNGAARYGYNNSADFEANQMPEVKELQPLHMHQVLNYNLFQQAMVQPENLLPM